VRVAANISARAGPAHFRFGKRPIYSSLTGQDQRKINDSRNHDLL
jgi:hypothetical protein